MSRIEEIAIAYHRCHGGWECACNSCPYNGKREECNNLENDAGELLKALAILQGADPKAFEKEDEDE